MPFKNLGNLFNKGSLSLSESSKGKRRDAGIYQSLNTEKQEIRLVVVQESKDDDMIHCTLKTRQVKSVIGAPYETISYVCGDPNNRKPVMMNKQPLEIPANAERALRRLLLRSPDSKRTVWIDALCINQTDVEEKSIQVGLMYYIYSGGVRNHIWLGEGDETTTRAIRLIQKLADEMKNEWRIRTEHGYVLSDKEDASYGLQFEISQADITAITRYYASDWFQRIWIIQEAVLPKLSSCHRGDNDYSCSLGSVLRAAKWLQHKAKYLPPGLPPLGIENAVRLYDACDPSVHDIVKWGSFGFIYMLRESQDLDTYEARDRIFALQGLVMKFSGQEPSLSIIRGEKPYTHLIHTNYNKTINKVFSDAALYGILEHKSLGILHDVEIRRGEDGESSLPSWVPNWGQKSNVDTNPTMMSMGFQAAGKEEFNVASLEEIRENELHVRGFVFSEVDKCSTRIAGDSLQATFRNDIAHTVCNLLSPGSEDAASLRLRYKNGLPMTVTGGLDHEKKRWKEGECENLSTAFDRVANTGEVPLLLDINDMSTNDERLGARFRQAMTTAIKNRCIFTTHSGKLGLGPGTMESGDLVCILYGCYTPVVLRRVFADKRQFRFVGVCYICGYMDGEAVEDQHKAGESDREIVLV